MGLRLALVFPARPKARLVRPDVRFAVSAHIAVLPAGNVFKMPCVLPLNVLILQVQLQCYLFFGIFLISQSQVQWLRPLKTLPVSASLWGRCYVVPCSVALCGIFFLSQSQKPLTHLWFLRQSNHTLLLHE